MPITARQRRVLDYIKHYFDVHQEAPTIAEIGKEFGMSSSASAHHVVSTLEREGFIRRIPNVSRGIELVSDEQGEAKDEIPLLGIVAAGTPIEAVLNYETVCVPRDMIREGRMFALRVRGDSMIDEQIRDNDVIVLQSKQTAENGQTVVARSEEHTSELQSLRHLVCRLLLEKKKTISIRRPSQSTNESASRKKACFGRIYGSGSGTGAPG